MSSPDEVTEPDDTEGLPPPVALPPGWYADPKAPNSTSLRYWDGSVWTDETAATQSKASKKKRARLGVRRSRVILTTVLLLVVAATAAGIGAWNLYVADRHRELTSGVNDQIATVRGETDELNAS